MVFSNKDFAYLSLLLLLEPKLMLILWLYAYFSKILFPEKASPF